MYHCTLFESEKTTAVNRGCKSYNLLRCFAYLSKEEICLSPKVCCYIRCHVLVVFCCDSFWSEKENVRKTICLFPGPSQIQLPMFEKQVVFCHFKHSKDIWNVLKSTDGQLVRSLNLSGTRKRISSLIHPGPIVTMGRYCGRLLGWIDILVIT